MGKIRVKNVDGHFENPPQGTWIAYWEEKTGRRATECNDITCHETDDLIGGHVMKDPFDGKVYLTPLCRKTGIRKMCMKSTILISFLSL